MFSSKMIKETEDRDGLFSDVVSMLLHRSFLLFLSGLLGGAAAFAFTFFFVRPAYQSRVSFYIYNNSDKNTNTDVITSSDLMAAEKLTATYANILGSNSVLDAVIRDMGGPEGLNRAVLGSMIQPSVVANTQILAVTVTTPDPEFSWRIASAFAEVAPEEISRITKAGSVEIVDRPEISGNKSSPDMLRDTCIGALSGMLIAAAVLILRMLSDTTIYLPDDVMKMTGAVVLGQIPEIIEDKNSIPWEKVTGGVIRYAGSEE